MTLFLFQIIIRIDLSSGNPRVLSDARGPARSEYCAVGGAYLLTDFLPSSDALRPFIFFFFLRRARPRAIFTSKPPSRDRNFNISRRNDACGAGRETICGNKRENLMHDPDPYGHWLGRIRIGMGDPTSALLPSRCMTYIWCIYHI